jgi:hypothetical protein
MIMLTRINWHRKLHDSLQYTSDCNWNSQTKLRLYNDAHIINPYRPFRAERWEAIHGTFGYINCIDPGAPKNDEEYYLKYR